MAGLSSLAGFGCCSGGGGCDSYVPSPCTCPSSWYCPPDDYPATVSFTWSWGGLCNPPGGTPQPYNPTCNVWGAGDTVTLNRIDDDLPYFCYPGYEIVDGRKVCYEPMVCNYPSYRSAIHSFQMPSTSGDPGTGGCVAPGCNSLVTVYYYVTLYGTGFYFCDALGNPAVDPIYGLSGLDCFPPGCGTQVITCDPFHLPCFNCVNGFSGFYGP